VSKKVFYGQNRHTIDPKGRAIFPAKYREKLGDVFYITRGLQSCLFVYPRDEWLKFEEKLKALPDSTGGAIQRYFFNNTEEVSFDKQGRVLIPGHLRDFAGLSKDIVIAGVSSKIEIWDAQKFDELNTMDNMSPDEISAQMELLGL
jgi:protein mraZ